jgi:hypothetical protein
MWEFPFFPVRITAGCMGLSSEIQSIHGFDKTPTDFSPYKEHVRLFRSLKFLRLLTVRSVRYSWLQQRPVV